MATIISPQAAVHADAHIGEDVEIGPFCVVGPLVKIGRGTRLENNVTLAGRVTLGEFNRIMPGAVIGGEPQDLSYNGAETHVVIGDHNVIREGVTINRGSQKEFGVTRLGDYNYLMACSHVAHDCQLGSHIVMANATLLGGHVHVRDHASFSGNVAVHHFATIGAYSFVAGLSRVLHDVPPFMLADGTPSRPRCVNMVAMKRNNFSQQCIESLQEAHRLLYRAKVGLHNAREILQANGWLCPETQQLLEFVECQQQGKHGRGREQRRAAA